MHNKNWFCRLSLLRRLSDDNSRNSFSLFVRLERNLRKLQYWIFLSLHILQSNACERTREATKTTTNDKFKFRNQKKKEFLLNFSELSWRMPKCFKFSIATPNLHKITVHALQLHSTQRRDTQKIVHILGICTRIYCRKCTHSTPNIILSCGSPRREKLCKTIFWVEWEIQMQNSFLNAKSNFLTFFSGWSSRSITTTVEWPKVETIMEWNETKKNVEHSCVK